LRCSFLLPDDWEQDILQIGFRLRGMLGLALKQGSCFFDARTTRCLACPRRAHCHYGQSFESMQSVHIDGLGKVGSMPHLWALQVQQLGLRVHVCLFVAGMELAHLPSWKSAIQTMPLNIVWQDEAWLSQGFQHQWLGVTPVRLRLKGKAPDKPEMLAKALLTSVVSKMKMISALHGIPLPSERLLEPDCTACQWCELSRFSLRTQQAQSMSGWLMNVHWSEHTPDAWKPWLNLALSLGVGRQTSFGMGRFSQLQ